MQNLGFRMGWSGLKFYGFQLMVPDTYRDLKVKSPGKKLGMYADGLLGIIGLCRGSFCYILPGVLVGGR